MEYSLFVEDGGIDLSGQIADGLQQRGYPRPDVGLMTKQVELGKMNHYHTTHVEFSNIASDEELEEGDFIELGRRIFQVVGRSRMVDYYLMDLVEVKTKIAHPQG